MQNGKIPRTTGQRLDALEAELEASRATIMETHLEITQTMAEMQAAVNRYMRRSQTLLSALWLLSALDIVLLVIIVILGTRP